MCEQKNCARMEHSKKHRGSDFWMEQLEKNWQMHFIRPDKRILWLVSKRNLHMTGINAHKIADLCFTDSMENFSFFGPGIDITVGCFYDTALDTAQMGEELEPQPTKEKYSIITNVVIRLIDDTKKIKADLYPEMDIIIVDQGDYCKMLKNKYGELKEFSWDINQKNREGAPYLLDFLGTLKKHNN